MKGLWTVFRREFAAYFNSPIAYIFIIVFLLASTAMFMLVPPFFAFPRADLKAFFGWLIPVVTIFVPAATMRIWAEERKDNTIEMLLTFPMKPAALVLGKYFAALVFYMTALAGTWLLPLMIAVLGEPDWGTIFSGYLGAVLLGALFLALGTFISGFCRDQIVAFVLSFVVCAFVSLVGWGPFVNILDGTITIGEHGLGSMLRSLVGMTGHYLPFTRGIVEVADIVYFVLWTVVFLFLNAVYLEGRSRPRMKLIFSATTVLCLAIGAAFNVLIADTTLSRFDLTEGRIYTVSDATKKILRELDVPVQIKVYMTRADKMPSELKLMERDITDKLDEMKIASGGKLQWKVIPMEATAILRSRDKEEEEDKEKSIEERLLNKGIRPFSVRAMREGEVVTQLIYSCVGIAYKDKEEELIPQVLPNTIPDLEYRLMNTIYKLTRDKPPIVALVAPVNEFNVPPQLLSMYRQRGITPPATEDPFKYLQQFLEHEKYTVRRIVELSQDTPLPEEYDALLLLNPRDFNDRQKWEINRALVEGVPTFMAIQSYRWNYSVQRNTVSISKTDDKPGLNKVLAPSGIPIDTNILMDDNCQPITISDQSNPLAMIMGGGMTLKLPMHVVVNPSSMNSDVAITSRLGPMFYLWGSALKLNREKIEENKLDVTTLFSTSPVAWTVSSSSNLTEADRMPPPDAKQLPLAILVKGQFADAYDGKERPAWPEKLPTPDSPMPPWDKKEEGEASPLNPAPGKLILVGCSEMFQRSSLSRSNADFFINSVDALTLGEELIHIRSKKPADRTIDKPSSATRSFWKFMNFAAMNILLAAVGLSRAFIRRRKRNRFRAR